MRRYAYQSGTSAIRRVTLTLARSSAGIGLPGRSLARVEPFSTVGNKRMQAADVRLQG